jgi:hypothetical protein
MKPLFQKAIFACLFLLPMTVFGAEPAKAGEKKTLIDTYMEGGWVMHLLLVFSIGMVWHLDADEQQEDESGGRPRDRQGGVSRG